MWAPCSWVLPELLSSRRFAPSQSPTLSPCTPRAPRSALPRGRAPHLAPHVLHPILSPAPCTQLRVPHLSPGSHPTDTAPASAPSLPQSPSHRPALPTSTHWPWDCMSSRTQGSDLLRVSRSRRCLQLTLSSTLERTASDACEDGSGASPMVAAARGAAGRDGGQAAPWDRGMWGSGWPYNLSVSAQGSCLSCPGHEAPQCWVLGWSLGAGGCCWGLGSSQDRVGLGSPRTLFEMSWFWWSRGTLRGVRTPWGEAELVAFNSSCRTGGMLG